MRENQSAEHRGSILQGWIAVEARTAMPTARQRDDYRGLIDWAAFNDLPMPVPGELVAEYLLELVADGESVARIKRVADSIAALYAQRRTFLDMIPIKAALALAAAQLDPNRIIN